jgi:ribosomal-protein-alanine N-acetyltransferase
LTVPTIPKSASGPTDPDANEPLRLKRIPLDDLPQVLELERSSFDDPWTVENFDAEFKRPFSLQLGLYQGAQLVAQSFSWLMEPEVCLLKLAVSPQRRRQGLGRRMMKRLLTIVDRTEARTVALEVSDQNLPAQALYRQFGFKCVAVRMSYYADGSNAMQMTLELPTGRPVGRS